MWDLIDWTLKLCHVIAQNVTDGGYRKKFVACNVAEVE